ncbi:hypothetical protein [Brachyspira hampsonii]|uniref:hypothetical protein n=1 Tax=Brachyspira hampsonii TaxID=1287055 RepID=UPI002159F3A4|nr:hypothetical protein [Brachyspira hampsonii]
MNFFDTINEYEETLRSCIIAYKVTNNPYWLFLAGDSALKNGDVKSADYYFNACVKQNNSYANEGFGDINYLNNQYDNAINNYRNAIYSNSEEQIRIQRKISNAAVKKRNIFMGYEFFISKLYKCNEYTKQYIFIFF